MSQLFVDNIKNRTGGAIGAPSGAVVTGVLTATSFSGNGSGLIGVASTDNIITSTASTFSDITTRNITGVAATFSGILTYEDVTNIDSVGLVTARSGIKIGPSAGVGGTFAADGSYVTAGIITAGSYRGDGSNLTGISAGGITTSQYSPAANAIIQIGLGTAQHHELTLSAGFTTITTSGGTYGESHSLVLIQPSSGIATVGFSTFFKFPSGSTPSMSEGSSKVDLVSFIVKDIAGNAGTGATELLASAGLNYI